MSNQRVRATDLGLTGRVRKILLTTQRVDVSEIQNRLDRIRQYIEWKILLATILLGIMGILSKNLRIDSFYRYAMWFAAVSVCLSFFNLLLLKILIYLAKSRKLLYPLLYYPLRLLNFIAMIILLGSYGLFLKLIMQYSNLL